MKFSYTLSAAADSTQIVIQPGARLDLDKLIEARGARRAGIITDKNVAGLYGHDIAGAFERAGIEPHIYAFEPGEESKTLGTISEIYDFLSASGITRTDIVAALGGGVPGRCGRFCGGYISARSAFNTNTYYHSGLHGQLHRRQDGRGSAQRQEQGGRFL